MELSTLVATLCVALSFVLASSASEAKEYGNSVVQHPQLALPSLPRKLKLQEMVNMRTESDKDIMLQKKLLEPSAGDTKVRTEEVMKINGARKGTWREWVESPNKSEYFTMDYTWVRRRRPIHNKQIPFVP